MINKLSLFMQRAAVAVLCCLAFTANAWGGDDDLKISGVIVDAVTAEPLIGASVMVQGTIRVAFLTLMVTSP